MSELFDLYRRNFPYCVREDAYAEYLLNSNENSIFEKRNECGELIGAAVVHKNNILMLCVDKVYRNQGFGTELLETAEKSIREKGFEKITVGAGDSYLMPGIPFPRPIVDEQLEKDKVYGNIEESGVGFFKKHGYTHRSNGNCFDMRMKLSDFTQTVTETNGINIRWAKVEDIPNIIECTDDAHKGFSKFYKNENIYDTETKQVLVAEDGDGIVGTLMVNFGVEGESLGSIGCTAVKHSHRGKKIATNLVIKATQALKEAGMTDGFLGYTYTGLDKMYGVAGYRICVYYFMAKKDI